MASIIKTDNIQKVSDDSNIIKKCGSTITIGSCGASVALACGATQTGFGRTGTVDWQTTKKTASFTAANGEGYFVDTSGGAVTMTLPSSPSAGDIVAFKDYSGNFSTNNLTIGRNGSNLDGSASDKAIDTNNTSMSLVYVDATQGWKSVEEGTGFIGENFICASGGTITTSGDFKIHTFTSDSTFTVNSLASCSANNTVDYLVVAGGASGGGNGGGGGGAGGFRLSNDTCMPAPQTSPLANSTGITVTATAFPITVGGGGASTSPPTGPGSPGPLGETKGIPGSNSVFSTITSAGGGAGGGNNTPVPNINVGGPGGSGGGSGVLNPSHSPPGGPGAGNTPPVSPPQGNAGGTGYSPYSAPYSGGGGGGAGAAGGSGAPGAGPGGAGSFVVGTGFAGTNGTTGPVCGARYFAGGGGSGNCASGVTGGTGGVGGGGTGTSNGNNHGPTTDATANTGGGGGGGNGSACLTGAGGSGIVVIRYKFQ